MQPLAVAGEEEVGRESVWCCVSVRGCIDEPEALVGCEQHPRAPHLLERGDLCRLRLRVGSRTRQLRPHRIQLFPQAERPGQSGIGTRSELLQYGLLRAGSNPPAVTPAARRPAPAPKTRAWRAPAAAPERPRQPGRQGRS